MLLAELLNKDHDDYLDALSAQKITTHKQALRYYHVRYASFIHDYPADSALSGCLLAQSGFYYDSALSSVRCVECSFHFKPQTFNALENESPECLLDIQARHYLFNKQCEQVKLSLEHTLDSSDDQESQTPTSSLTRSVDSGSEYKVKYASLESRLATFGNTKMATSPKDLAQNGLFLVNTKEFASLIPTDSMTLTERLAQIAPFLLHVKCAFCPFECMLFKNSQLTSNYNTPFDEHREKCGSRCPMFDAEASLSGPKELDEELPGWLRYLYNFESTSSDLMPEDECRYQMKGVVSDVEETETVTIDTDMPKIIEYLLYAFNSGSSASSPKSNMIINSPNSNSSSNLVYMPSNKSTSSSSSSSNYDQLQPVLTQTTHVINEKAHSPAFSQYQARLETFRDWPATLAQQPADLARAGFYYFGIKDMVKCFFCNGGLKNWDHNDDPFEDHVRWFPKCQYIRQLMGLEYVETIREKYKKEESGFNSLNASGGTTSNTETSNNSSSSKSSENKPNKKRSTSPRSLNSRMDTNIIRKILDNSILSREAVKHALDIKLSAQIDDLNRYEDFKSHVELARSAYQIDQFTRSKNELIGSLGQFIICNLPTRLTADNLRKFFSIRFGLRTARFKLVKFNITTSGETNEHQLTSFCLVTLKSKEKHLVDEILTNLKKESLSRYLKPGEENLNIVAFKTDWQEIEEKLKPLFMKEMVNMMSSSETPQPPISTNLLSPSKKKSNEPPVESSPSNKQEATSSTGGSNSCAISAGSVTNANNTELIEELKNKCLCLICLDQDKKMLFLPCSHLVTCFQCSMSLQKCPMCRSDIQAKILTFS